MLYEHRLLISAALSAALGATGLWVWPFPTENAVLRLIHVAHPTLWTAMAYTYATLWFTTVWLACSVVTSLMYIFLGRIGRQTVNRPLPPYPPPGTRGDLSVVLGEQHHANAPMRSTEPQWLTIPERGLYTGLAIIGAVGTGKTSACIYPYAEQLLGFAAGDEARKVSALILEVKGDVCRHVQDILERHGRAADYVEVSLTSRYRYNPLHNDLDAYAMAYGVATLMTNLFGRGKEPFWQQASTNLVKFVILLHQTLDDYVTLFQVNEQSSTRTSCALGLPTGKCDSDVVIGASWWTSGRMSTRLPCRPGRGTTTIHRGWRGPRGTRISRRPLRRSESRSKPRRSSPGPALTD